MPPSRLPSQALGHSVVHALSTAPTAAEATRAVLCEVAGAFGSPLVVLWLLDESSGLLGFSDDWSDREELADFRDLCRRLTFAAGVGLPGRVLEEPAPAVVADIAGDDRFPRAAMASAAGLRSAMAAPLTAAGGGLGVLEVFFDGADPQLAAGLDELATVARQLAAYLARVRVEERLRTSEEGTSSIFQAALDCVILMDHGGRIIDLNPAAEATFGYERDAVTGDLLADRIIPPDLRQAHRRALARYLESGEPRILNRRLELTGMRADGTTFPVELTVTRLGSSEPAMFAGFLRDITERHEAEAERNRLLVASMTARAHAEAAQERSAAARAAAEGARSQAEAAGKRLAVLARAGERMLAIHGYDDAAQQVVELAVPDAADWCVVAISERPGAWRTVAAAHRDPPKAALVRELVERHGPAADASAVLSSGRTEAIEPVSEAALERLASDAGHLDALRRLEPRSIVTVPLRSARRVFGAITLAMAGSGRSFAPEDVSMAESLAARAALALENARLLSERSHIAETLQRSLLPAELPAIPGLDVAGRYRAAGEENLVGGDFYDVFPSGEGVWTAILGDVSGKGPAAAAVTALTRHTLRAAALGGAGPVESLRLLNEALIASRREVAARFATVVYARLCPVEAGAVVTVSAGGQPPPLVLRAAGELEPVEVSGTLLGALETVELFEVDVRLNRGDVMVLYTDGVTEIRTDDPRYGERLLGRVLREHATAPADALVAAIEHAAVTAQGGEPRDDIALIAVRVE